MIKRKQFVWLLISALVVASLVLSSCNGGTTTTTEPTSAAPTSAEPTSVTPTSVTPTSVTPTQTTTTTPTAAGNWWDALGTPEYGGSITFRALADAGNFDNQYPWTSQNYGWYEHVLTYDFSVDRKTWSFKTAWAPLDYCTGELIDKWEWVDPTTLKCHVREGVKWQNKAPSNGREFTAYDVGAHYDRLFATGKYAGQKPNPYTLGWISAIKGCEVVDEHTVNMLFKAPTPLQNMWSMIEQAVPNQIENPDAVDAGTIGNFDSICGTGPFMAKDWIKGSTLTVVRNPDYWGYDARYPENQLPYADELRIIVIQDTSTALSAVKTGKLDYCNNIEWQQATSILKSNPELASYTLPVNGYALEFRVDNAPFTDINVRKALQMSINLDEIAKGYYGGLVDSTPIGMIAKEYAGWGYTYSEWPQELKDTFTYNVEGAKKLLSDAGYPNGFSTNLVMSASDDQALMQVVQSYFKAINVNMEIRVMDATSFSTFTVAKKHDQMGLSPMTAQTQPPPISIYQYHSKNGTNYTNNNDAAYDALYDAFNAAADLTAAKAAYKATEKYYFEQKLVTNLTPRLRYVLMSPYVKGLAGELVDGNARVQYWSHLWVDKKLKTSMGR
jgi:ABC-type transport system substrate-binding protein